MLKDKQRPKNKTQGLLYDLGVLAEDFTGHPFAINWGRDCRCLKTIASLDEDEIKKRWLAFLKKAQGSKYEGSNISVPFFVSHINSYVPLKPTPIPRPEPEPPPPPPEPKDFSIVTTRAELYGYGKWRSTKSSSWFQKEKAAVLARHKGDKVWLAWLKHNDINVWQVLWQAHKGREKKS